MVELWMLYAPIIVILVGMVAIGLWGARKTRKDIFKLARVKDEEEEETG